MNEKTNQSDNGVNIKGVSIPAWIASTAIALFVALLVVSFITGRKVTWSPFGFDVVTAGIVPSSVNLPLGSIVAFAQRECPPSEEGWRRFEDAEGRFILGWSDGEGLPSMESRAIRQFDSEGGAETHTLSIDEMPAHTHPFQGSPFTRGGYGGGSRDDVSQGGNVIPQNTLTPRGEVLSNGGDQPHNNMPPYIALTWCITI